MECSNQYCRDLLLILLGLLLSFTVTASTHKQLLWVLYRIPSFVLYESEHYICSYRQHTHLSSSDLCFCLLNLSVRPGAARCFSPNLSISARPTRPLCLPTSIPSPPIRSPFFHLHNTHNHCFHHCHLFNMTG